MKRNRKQAEPLASRFTRLPSLAEKRGEFHFAARPRLDAHLFGYSRFSVFHVGAFPAYFLVGLDAPEMD